jgi:hypothetical protein
MVGQSQCVPLPLAGCVQAFCTCTAAGVVHDTTLCLLSCCSCAGLTTCWKSTGTACAEPAQSLGSCSVWGA